MLAVRVASRLAQPAQCEVTLDATTVEWPFGAPLRVRLAGDDDALFDGEVTCVELAQAPDGVATVRLRAYDRLHRLRKRLTMRVFEAVTAVDVAEALTGDLDLSVSADDPGPRFERIVQHRQNDFDLLVEVAARSGLYPVVRDGVLRLVTLRGTGDDVTLHMGESLHEARVEANLDRVARGVTVLGWHPQQGTLVRASAETARLGRASTVEPDPAAIGVDGQRVLVDRPAGAGEDPAATAQAALDRSAAAAVTLTGVAHGDRRLWAGGRIDVRGVPAAFEGRYVVCEAVHTVDGSGCHTAISTEPPRAPESPTAPRSPSAGSWRSTTRTGWAGCGCACPPTATWTSAGWACSAPARAAARDWSSLPDVDDTVLVALPHEAPAEGVVLGSLYGTVSPPDPGIDGSSVRRWSMRTARGQSIVVDDAAHLIRVENHGGSFVELAPDVVRLHAKADLVLEAPGRSITVRAQSVDFEHTALPAVP